MAQGVGLLLVWRPGPVGEANQEVETSARHRTGAMLDTACELPRIHLPGSRVNRPWALLRASPFHGVDHLLRLKRELIELGSRTNEAKGHRLSLQVLQDEQAHLISFN